jgi:hypothetical protein
MMALSGVTCTQCTITPPGGWQHNGLTPDVVVHAGLSCLLRSGRRLTNSNGEQQLMPFHLRHPKSRDVMVHALTPFMPHKAVLREQWAWRKTMDGRSGNDKSLY